jgi:hypothetical protein
MGFHIYISCTLDICKDTGRHFYYKGFEKVYDMPPLVPKEYREFVNMKGKVFRDYVNLVTDEMSTSACNFLDKYPDWSDIVENSEHSEAWNETEHDRFYTALQWFSDQGNYTISWSY